MTPVGAGGSVAGYQSRVENPTLETWQTCHVRSSLQDQPRAESTMGKTEAQVLAECCVEFCPSELGTREAADLPRSTAKLRNAAKNSVASKCKS